MIGAIVQKEFTECRRDGRVLGIGCLMGFLVLVSLITGWASHEEQQHQVRQAQRDDQATFIRQGEKPTHSAAHFGRMAYKPVAALAVFDPGAAPYLGQVIWLEAHRQDPAMFRPAEDAPELRRLADLSVAGVLTMLLPLLIFLMGAGAFAAERERGTLRQILSTGPAINAIFAGKLAIVAGMGAGIACLALAVSIGVAVLAPSGSSAWDILARGAGLMVGYSLYSLACAGVALVVSARARSTTSALLILLSVWALSVVILPRVAASLAAHIHPTPDSGTFWTRTSSAIRANQPARKSEEYRALERQVLSRALGREITADEAASLNLNRAGLYLEISEVLGARAYSDAYQDLYANYENQQRLRRLVSIFSPAISLQHFSSAISGTDSAAHRHFASEAERQRQLVIRTMNEDMMLNGAGQGNAYLSSADFWERIPDFVYRAPSASVAIRSAVWDLLVLAAWSVVAFWLAWRSACRQSVV